MVTTMWCGGMHQGEQGDMDIWWRCAKLHYASNCFVWTLPKYPKYPYSYTCKFDFIVLSGARVQKIPWHRWGLGQNNPYIVSLKAWLQLSNKEFTGVWVGLPSPILGGVETSFPYFWVTFFYCKHEKWHYTISETWREHRKVFQCYFGIDLFAKLTSARQCILEWAIYYVHVDKVWYPQLGYPRGGWLVGCCVCLFSFCFYSINCKTSLFWWHKPFQPFIQYPKEVFVVKIHMWSKSGRMVCSTPNNHNKNYMGNHI